MFDKISNVYILIIVLLTTISITDLSGAGNISGIDLVKMPYFANKINQSVQLKENTWVKIINDYYDEETIGEANKRMGLKTQNSAIDNMVMQRVIVWVQFLKPCKAISNNEELLIKYNNKPIPDFELKNMFEIENMTPRYKCDYRTKIFVTFFDNNGFEIDTKGEQPIAPFEDGKRKYEILPGEKRFVIISAPQEASYYYSWVPK